MKKRLANLIPVPIRPELRKIYHLPRNIIGGIHAWLTFKKIGLEFKNYFIDLAHLKPEHCVLEVGCGIGRMATPLTDYLSGEGEYWGIDVIKEEIDGCRRRISTKFGNFHFQHVDIYNKFYNPAGQILAQDFHLPFEDRSFDLVFLTSVFTHMLPVDVENYMSEISRVLKTGGTCLMTFFLLTVESQGLIKSGRSTLDFKHEMDGYLTTNNNVPEIAIAFDEKFVKRLFEKHGLEIAQPIRYGSWCGRDRFLSYQDLVIATKL